MYKCYQHDYKTHKNIIIAFFDLWQFDVDIWNGNESGGIFLSESLNISFWMVSKIYTEGSTGEILNKNLRIPPVIIHTRDKKKMHKVIEFINKYIFFNYLHILCA